MQDKKPSYSCEVCFKTFQFRGAYTDHLKTHANTDVRHECSECPCFFKNRGHLKTHIKEVHRSHTRIYKCSQCSRKFDSKPLYTQHRRREHTQSTRHQCAFCQHVYATKNSLKWHIHINHNKDFRKSKCPYCPSEFKWPHHLRVHIKKSHMEQGFTPTDLLKKGLTSIRRKSNNCIVCDVKFEKKLELMLHLRNVHKQELDIYKCCRCDAVFNLKSSLRNHIIDHKRRKDGYMHECPQCHPEITPQLFVQEKETDTLVEDNRTEIEKELIDFEITLMEDEDIRGMIRCRLKHKPRRRRRTGLLMKTDVEPENIVVEPTILDSGKYEVAAVDGDVAGGDTGRQIQVCLERISAHECRLCKCTFSHEDTLCMHMSLTHPTAPVTSNKNITIAATSEDVGSPECSVKDVSTPKTSDSKGTPKKDTVPEKDVTTPKSVENVDEVSQADKDVFNTPKRDEKDANVRTPKSVENVDKVSQADKDVLNTPKRDEKDANVRTPKSVENVDKVSQAHKDVLNTPKRDEKDANVRTPKSVENVDKISQAAKDVLYTPKRDEKDANGRTPKNVEKVDKISQAAKDVLNTPKRDEKDANVRTPKSVEKVDKVIKADKDVLNTPKRDEKDPKIKTTEKNVTPKKVAWKKSYTCHVCMEKFNMPLQLGRHIRLTHNLIKCKLCKTSFTKTKVDTHKCIKRKSVSVKTERKSPKASNVRIAASPKKRTKKGTLEECGKCALYFNTRLELIRHISDVHMFTGKQKEKDDFSCDKCNTKFLSRDEVSGHVKICKGDK